jgi:urease accessory protein UreE
VLLDRVLEVGGPCDDELELAWWELDRRAFQKTTRAGVAVRILMPRGRDLRHGDVLTCADATLRAGVHVKSCEALVVRPPDASAMGVLALELGNLHLPTEIIDGVLRTIPDGPAEQAISQLGLAFERQVICFQPRRCAGVPQVRLSNNFRVVGS